MKTADIRDLAGRIVGIHGRFHGEGNQGHNYSANYDGHTFYSDCTCNLAEKIADYIKEKS